ncbi:MAG: GNAT family N-acetyltransferase, partial [Bacteroidales bacterium]|nr:GNAT family N-acetyltransferase [Bacteroidales bacterium]
MNISYKPFQVKDLPELKTMIHALYLADGEPEKMTDEKINHTVAFLSTHPGHGEIILFCSKSEVVGYSILINYWSNEFGGNVLYIDELFIKEAFRSQRIGTEFIKYLIRSEYNNCRALSLEVVGMNDRA